ncbi:peptidoglycan recognition protein family protein [Actinoplanes sp. HUAS TT8]|uniref:peptidoglycan recognition protein family protein n=1 Tax=Actinoplanes sp. HUAS TT8 TaxID=3447453 RepID=UPI003F51E643
MRRNNRLVTAAIAATPVIALAVAAGLNRSPEAGPVLQTFPFSATGAGLRLVAETGADEVAAVVPERDTKRFSLVGVTWDDPRAVAGGTIQVRTRPVGARSWAPWQTLETDAPDESGGADGGPTRGASDPLWAGPSDGVQARVVTGDDVRPLPAGMRVDLINPDVVGTPRPDLVPAALERPRRVNGVEIPARPVPRLMTRAAWGADESMVKEPPTYTGPVQVFFVHHTATGNDYSCQSSTGVVRGIEAYQVKSKGWNDIGYNFLVDKCGTIFEGRRGGVDRNVLGAHTLGFNTNASAVAVIGDFRSTPISAAARLSVAQLAAYKLGGAGNAPYSRVALTSGGGPKFAVGRRVLLNRISGHRDAGLTECPGTALYRQLTAIRQIAGGAPAGLRVTGLTGAQAWGSTYWAQGGIVPLWRLATSSRMIDRFDVYVDGELTASRAGAMRSAGLRLGAGLHRIEVRARHLSGRTATAYAKVVVDSEEPVFASPPQAYLTEGTVGTTAPIRLDWSATDPSGIRSAQVGGAGAALLGGTVSSLTGSAPVGTESTWTVAVTDHAGNRRTASVSRTPEVLPESEATRTGSWRAVADGNHLGGAAVAAATAGSALTWTVTGRSVGLIAARSSTSGRVKVSVDGESMGYVDLRASSPQYRRLVFSKSWPDSATRTVRVEPEGTSGRPTVIVDGLASLR